MSVDQTTECQSVHSVLFQVVSTMKSNRGHHEWGDEFIWSYVTSDHNLYDQSQGQTQLEMIEMSENYPTLDCHEYIQWSQSCHQYKYIIILSTLRLCNYLGLRTPFDTNERLTMTREGSPVTDHNDDLDVEGRLTNDDNVSREEEERLTGDDDDARGGGGTTDRRGRWQGRRRDGRLTTTTREGMRRSDRATTTTWEEMGWPTDDNNMVWKETTDRRWRWREWGGGTTKWRRWLGKKGDRTSDNDHDPGEGETTNRQRQLINRERGEEVTNWWRRWRGRRREDQPTTTTHDSGGGWMTDYDITTTTT